MHAQRVATVLALAVGMAAPALPAADQRVLAAAELFPLEPRETPFVVTDGDREGARIPLVLAPAETAAAEWMLRLENFNTLYLQRGPDGGILLTRLDLAGQNKAIVYHEPMPFLPAQIKPRQTYQHRSPVQVIDLNNGEQTRSGNAAQQIHPARQTTFHLPAGPADGYLLEARQTLELDDVTVYLTVESGFAPGDGMLYRRLRYEIGGPLLYGSASHRTVERAEQ